MYKIQLDYGRFVVCDYDGLVVFSSYSEKACDSFISQPFLFNFKEVAECADADVQGE